MNGEHGSNAPSNNSVDREGGSSVSLGKESEVIEGNASEVLESAEALLSIGMSSLSRSFELEVGSLNSREIQQPHFNKNHAKVVVSST